MNRPSVHTQALYRQLISRLDSLHLEPGDFLTITFPERLYQDPLQLADAQNFAQQVANLTKHQVLILKEGVALGIWDPGAQPRAKPAITLPDL